jgi:hypothetical protein
VAADDLVRMIALEALRARIPRHHHAFGRQHVDGVIGHAHDELAESLGFNGVYAGQGTLLHDHPYRLVALILLEPQRKLVTLVQSSVMDKLKDTVNATSTPCSGPVAGRPYPQRQRRRTAAGQGHDHQYVRRRRKVWTGPLKLEQKIAVPGLSPLHPEVHCNADDVCQMTTDMGKANAAASVAAMVHSGLFDLRATYFLVAGIGGIDPAQGTTGTAAWSRYLVGLGPGVGARCARTAGRLAHRLPRHQHENADRYAAAALRLRDVPVE